MGRRKTNVTGIPDKLVINERFEREYEAKEEWKKRVDYEEVMQTGEKLYANGAPFPMLSDDAREQVCINLAYNLVEQRLRAGVATPTEICQLLKTGSTLAKLQMKQAEMDQKLTESKIKSLASQAEQEQLLKEAIAAFGSYTTSLDAVDNDQELGDETYDFQN